MATAAKDRRTRDRPDVGELTDLSPSRIRTADMCGLKFQYQYVDQLPAPEDRAATIFGSVLHEGVHRWYGMDGRDGTPDRHREQDLPEIVHKLWSEFLPAAIWRQTCAVIEAGEELDSVESMIRLTRPHIKGPRQTKAFMESSAWTTFHDAEQELIDACEQHDTIKWPKDEYPYKAWCKSRDIAQRLQEQWRPLPRPLAVERPFMLDFDKFRVRGQLDQFRLDPDPEGEVVPDLRDLKTGRQLLTQMEAFIQVFLYHEAVRQFDDLPTPGRVTIHNLRQDKVQEGKIDYERHKKLAVRILNGVARRIITGAYEPHYGFWCGRCDYRGLCEEELSLWTPETDGLTLLPAS